MNPDMLKAYFKAGTCMLEMVGIPGSGLLNNYLGVEEYVPRKHLW